MNLASIVNIDSLALRVNEDIIKHRDISITSEAYLLVDDCKKQISVLLENARHSIAKAEQDGFNNGLRKGEELASKLIFDTEIKASDYLHNLENTVVDLVLQVVRKLAIRLGSEAVVSDIAIETVKTFKSQSSLHIKVNPKNKEKVSKIIDSVNKAQNSHLIYDVIADSQIELMDCVVESKIGIVKTGLELQLSLIEASMKHDPSRA